MPETNILESLTHLSEIITDAINGIFAFLVYWPFIWLFFHLEYFKTSPYDVIKCSYAGLAGIIVHADILALPLIILVLPCIGLLNRAIVSTFIDTLVVRGIFGYSGGPTIQNRPKKKDGGGSKSKKKEIFWRQKQLWGGLYKILGKISVSIRKFTIWTLDKQLARSIKDKELWKIDGSLYPCWRLEGSFDYVNYRHWLIKNPTRKSYWDWEHFLDWVYKSYYQTLLMFLIMYSVLLLYIAYISHGYGPQAFVLDHLLSIDSLKSYVNNNLASLCVFILALPTYALYREYLKHHIAWIRMDQKFYVDYLIEKRKVSGRKILKKYLEEENYKKVENKLKAYFNTKNGYDKIS